MASNTIKGLTVEIGGDTTKLGKALKNIEAESGSLSKELGEINRLLKMDPGNTELLAQKQKVLADAVESTAKKLDTLKTAEKQVQAQFEKGEVSEAQVRALQREIIATENKMEGYKKAIKETEGALNGMGKETKEADKSSEGLGKTLANAAKAGLAAVGAVATAVSTGLVAAAESTREYRAEMGKLESAFSANNHSAKTATATYKTLQGVIGETDQSVEAAQQISLLANSEKEAAQWADLAAGVVGQFGDALQPETFFEAANETLKLNTATGAFTQMLEGCGLNVEEFNAGLAACTTEAEKQAYMLQVTEGALGAAGEKYKEVNGEIIRANQANEAWMQSLAGVGGAIEPIISDVKIMGASILSELVPGVQQLADAFRGVINGEAGAADALGTAFSGIITQVLGVVTELAPTLVQVATSLITTLATTLISQLPQLATTGVELILTIVNGISQAVPQLVTAISDMIPQLVQTLVTGIPQLVQGVISLVSSVAQAIPEALPAIVAAIPQLVMGLVDGLLAGDMISQLISGAVTFLTAIIKAIPPLLNLLVPKIPGIVKAICDALISNVPVLLNGALSVLQALVDAIPLICKELIPQIPVIVRTIISCLLEMTPVLLAACCDLLFALIEAIPVLIAELFKALPAVLSTIGQVLGALPQLIWSILSTVLTKVAQWIVSLAARAMEAGSKFINNVISFISQLPGKIWSFLQTVVSNVVQFGSNAVAKAKTAAKNILDAVVDGVKSLPDKIKETGKNLVEGLWNGINDMTGWIIGKIQSFGDDVLSGIKSFFGIKSPSRVFRDQVGAMLAEGLAEGIEQNADAPLDALASLGDDMLGQTEGFNGLTMTRQLNHTFSGDSAAAQTQNSLLGKLDSILTAIECGKVIAIDGKQLIGATVGGYDQALGLRRDLMARGAL